MIDRVAAEPSADALALLAACDHPRIGGETTAVLLAVRPDGIRGAAVGDSGAWIVGPSDVAILTADVPRKPLLGSGEASPTPIGADPLARGATLLLATDGLLKYASEARIADAVRSATDLADTARRLVDLVRLRNGELQDDVGIVLCRRRA